MGFSSATNPFGRRRRVFNAGARWGRLRDQPRWGSVTCPSPWKGLESARSPRKFFAARREEKYLGRFYAANPAAYAKGARTFVAQPSRFCMIRPISRTQSHTRTSEDSHYYICLSPSRALHSRAGCRGVKPHTSQTLRPPPGHGRSDRYFPPVPPNISIPLQYSGQCVHAHTHAHLYIAA